MFAIMLPRKKQKRGNKGERKKGRRKEIKRERQQTDREKESRTGWLKKAEEKPSETLSKQADMSCPVLEKEHVFVSLENKQKGKLKEPPHLKLKPWKQKQM